MKVDVTNVTSAFIGFMGPCSHDLRQLIENGLRYDLVDDVLPVHVRMFCVSVNWKPVPKLQTHRSWLPPSPRTQLCSQPPLATSQLMLRKLSPGPENSSHCLVYTETEMCSIDVIFVSGCQLPVQPVKKISSKWWKWTFHMETSIWKDLTPN